MADQGVSEPAADSRGSAHAPDAEASEPVADQGAPAADAEASESATEVSPEWRETVGGQEPESTKSKPSESAQPAAASAGPPRLLRVVASLTEETSGLSDAEATAEDLGSESDSSTGGSRTADKGE